MPHSEHTVFSSPCSSTFSSLWSTPLHGDYWPHFYASILLGLMNALLGSGLIALSVLLNTVCLQLVKAIIKPDLLSTELDMLSKKVLSLIWRVAIRYLTCGPSKRKKGGKTLGVCNNLSIPDAQGDGYLNVRVRCILSKGLEKLYFAITWKYCPSVFLLYLLCWHRAGLV